MISAKGDWWLPETNGGFFGENYKKGDDSKEGPCPIHPQVLDARTEREIAYLKLKLQLKEGDSILDCPCGYGRHSVKLAGLGLRVVGIDINPGYIDIANREAQRILAPESRPRFELSDMRKLPLEDSSFDFCVNMFTSFGFFERDEEDEKVITEFHRVLKTGGKLLIHFDYNYYKVQNGTWAENRTRTLKGGFMLRVFDELSEDGKYIYGYWQILNNRAVVFERAYRLRAYSPEELTAMLVDSGFRKPVFFGTLDKPKKILDTYDCESVVVAERA